MRSLLIVAVLTSCDLKPGRSQDKPAQLEPGPPAPSEPAPAPAGNPNIPPGAGFVDAGVPRPLMKASEDCAKVGEHVTNLVATANPSLVQGDERGRMLRRIAETCTRDAWTEDKRTCFMASKTSQEAESCGRDLKAPAD